MKGTKPHLVVINGALSAFPAPPDWLSLAAQKEWQRVQPYLEERKMLTDIDLSNLENYCVAQGRIRECEAEMATVNDLNVKSKLWRMQNQAMATARQIAAELGLTPMARSRPVIRDLFDGEDDPLNIS